VAVVIRMKQMGRAHRPFYRICAADRRTPRDGRVIEELGTYDPSVADTNARCTLNAARVDYWLGVGAQPSDKVRVLIKLSMPRIVPEAGEPVFVPKPPEEPAAEGEATVEATPETPAAEATTEASAEGAAETTGDAPTADATAEAAPVEEAPAEGEATSDDAETKAE